MILQLNLTLGVLLIALVLGTSLLVWSDKGELCCKKFAKFIAYFTIVISILAMGCTLYTTLNCSSKSSCGYTKNCDRQEAKSSCAKEKKSCDKEKKSCCKKNGDKTKAEKAADDKASDDSPKTTE